MFHEVLIIFVQSCALELEVSTSEFNKLWYHIQYVMNIEFSKMIRKNGANKIAMTMKIEYFSSQQLVH